MTGWGFPNGGVKNEWIGKDPVNGNSTASSHSNTTLPLYCSNTTVREYVFYVFFGLKTYYFLCFLNDVSKSRKKSATFCRQYVKMSQYTSPSDHCNSIPSSRSVIHSEPLLNVNVYRNFSIKIPGCHGDLQAFITHSSKLHGLLCPHF